MFGTGELQMDVDPFAFSEGPGGPTLLQDGSESFGGKADTLLK